MDREVTPQQLRAWLQQEPAPLVLDVRDAGDYGREPDRIPAAVKLNHGQLETWSAELPSDGRIVVYCQHGQRISNLVLDNLLARGLRACLLTGGMAGWRAAGGQTESP